MPDYFCSPCTPFDWAVIIFCSFYTLMQGYLLFFALRIPRKKSCQSSSQQNASLIIPCKNEDKRLPALIKSLTRLHYTADLEIIFIDDGSSDGTRLLLEQFAARSNRRVRILSNHFEPDKQLTSKQQALELGVTAASYDLIALTDADMELHENWLVSLCDQMDYSTALVFGHTIMPRSTTCFAFLQAFHLEFLFAIATLFHYARLTGSCMGNNMLIRKKAYCECGGQRAIGYSITEDQALLRLFHQHHLTTGISVPFFPTATTQPHETVSGFLQQMARWAIGGFSSGRNLLFFSGCFMLHIVLSLTALTGVFTPLGNLAVLTSVAASWLVIIITFTRNRSTVSPFSYPILYPMMVIEACFIAWTYVTGKKLQWKERSI